MNGTIFCDIDGTLIPAGSYAPSAELLACLKQIMKKWRLVIASGRNLAGASYHFRCLGDRVIYSTDNGSRLVQNGRDLIEPKSIVMPDLWAIVESVVGLGCSVLLSSDNCYFAAGTPDEFTVKLCESQGCRVKKVERPEDIDRKVYHLTISHPGIASPLEALQKKWGDRYSVAQSHAYFVDISPATKATAVEAAQKLWGESTDSMWAFGDTGNDIEILKAVGHPFVMAEGSDYLHRLFPDSIIPNVESQLEKMV